MSEIEIKLGGGQVTRTVNGGEPETFEYEFGLEDEECTGCLKIIPGDKITNCWWCSIELCRKCEAKHLCKDKAAHYR